MAGTPARGGLRDGREGNAADLFRGGDRVMAERRAAAAEGTRARERPAKRSCARAYEAELRRITAPDLIAPDGGLADERRRLRAWASRAASGPSATSSRCATRSTACARCCRSSNAGVARQQLAPLRDALSQLQLAYARELQAAAGRRRRAAAEPPGAPARRRPPQRGRARRRRRRRAPASRRAGRCRRGATGRPPGPAQSSGRLWVPGQG